MTPLRISFYNPILVLFFLAGTFFAPSALSQKLVTTKPISEIAIFPVGDAPATTVSLNNAFVSAEVTGPIIDIPVKVGDEVEKGTTIVKLSCTDHELSVARARAAFKAAKADESLAKDQFSRAQRLFKANAGSKEAFNTRQSQFDKATANVNSQYAMLETAKKNVEKCEIKAPFSAVIIDRIASIGEYAVPGMRVVRLLDKDQLEISASVQEQDIRHIKDSRHIYFVSGNQRYPTSLRTVLPVVDSRLRSFQVRLDFTDTKASPGEAGRIQWKSTIPHIPADLLVLRNGKLGVFIAVENIARFIPIPDALEGHPGALDMPDETLVIMDGRFALNDGDTINISTD